MDWTIYDADPQAVIEAGRAHAPVPNFPPLVVSTFSKKIIQKYVQKYRAKKVAHIVGANGENNIYVLNWQGTPVAFYMSRVGAPACVADFEELIALGGRQFVFFGSCGALDAALVEGHFVVPTAAIRDEGTSHHYLPPAGEIALDAGQVELLAQTLQDMGYPYIKSKTWTTDGFYRETVAKVAAARSRGCTVVEMECAALAAAARVRGVGFAQFLYTADNLDAPCWEARDLHDHGMSRCEKYMAAAFQCVLRMGGGN